MKTNNAIQPSLPPAHRYRRMAMVLAALFTACFSVLTPATAQTPTSAVPNLISYQGRVLNSSGGLVGAGTPVNRTVTFRIWDHASNTLATNLLYSEQQTVTISEGEFSVLVGQGVPTSGTPLGFIETSKGPTTGASPFNPGSLSVFAGSTRYLGVTVDDGTAAVDNEITPRQQIVSSAYALRAKYAESLGSNGGTALTTLDSGNVGIGNANPLVKLQVTGGSDANLGSSTGFMAIGDTGSTNVVFDDNEIQARNNGVAANLILNELGGNVSIGNASPTARLDVTGGIKATGAGGYTFNTGDLDGGLFSPADGVITLTTNGAEKVRVDGSGNLGIGTTAAKQLLDVNGSVNVRGGHLVFDNASGIINWGPSGSLFFRTLTTQGAIAGYQDRMAIDSTGRVGIGTNSPAALLSLGSTLANSKLMLYDDGTSFHGLGVQTNQFRLHTATSSDRFSFLNAPNGTENMTILGNGNVGVGTTTPGERLTIVGSGSTNASIALSVFNSALGPLMHVRNDGNVGLGTSTPGSRLEVNGKANATVFQARGIVGTHDQGAYIEWNRWAEGETDFNNQKGLGSGGFTFNEVDANNNYTERMRISASGNVGIGTSTPTYAKLVINGGPSQTGLSASYLQSGGGSFTAVGHAAHIFSIYATGGIRSDDGFYASSDARMKIIEGVSDGGADLRSLLSIEVTNYRYRDKVAKGDSVQKKVVAQQVEKVYPQAVSRVTNVLPDIYQKAVIKEGWIMLKTDLKKGEHVRLIDNQTTNLFEVLEVKEGKFRTAFEPQGDEVFVYGREVNDFRVVDYEAIAMLNVSATQQIKKEKDAEIKALKDENTSLKDQLEAQSKQLAELQAKDKARDVADKARDAKLAAIEKALESTAAKPAVRTASLKKAE